MAKGCPESPSRRAARVEIKRLHKKKNLKPRGVSNTDNARKNATGGCSKNKDDFATTSFVVRPAVWRHRMVSGLLVADLGT